MNNPKYIFRMTHIENITTFVRDGYMYAPSHNNQPQWTISYSDIVHRRDSNMGTNNKVAFYFSPITSMAYTIAENNVTVNDSNGRSVGNSCFNDIVFMVMDIETVIFNNYTYQFTDQAYNRSPNIATVYDNWDNDKDKVNWDLFNENPYKGSIPEIAYGGTCRYFFNDPNRDGCENRSAIRMAEFWIKDRVDIRHLTCFIVKNKENKSRICDILEANGIDVAVYVKPDVFF